MNTTRAIASSIAIGPTKYMNSEMQKHSMKAAPAVMNQPPITETTPVMR